MINPIKNLMTIKPSLTTIILNLTIRITRIKEEVAKAEIREETTAVIKEIIRILILKMVIYAKKILKILNVSQKSSLAMEIRLL